MQIIGVGLDATEIARVADMIERYGDRFIHKVFTEGEVAYCRARRDFASSFAARFAAKEAAMKALGTGHSRGVFWTGIEVVRRYGPPQIRFHGGAAARFANPVEAARRAMALGQTTFILSMALSEAVSLVGLMLHMLGAPIMVSIPFFVVGTTLAAIRFPTVGRLVGDFERTHGASFAASMDGGKL